LSLPHGGERVPTVAVELLGEEQVLRHLHGVLEEPVDQNDVDADELAAIPDRLGGDVADVRDELQLQVVGLLAGIARTQVGRDVLALAMERAVHASDTPVHGGGRRIGV